MSLHRQRGLGFLGFFFLLAAIAFVSTVGMRMFPLYMNEVNLQRAVREVASRQDLTGADTTHEAIRKALGRWWEVDDIRFIKPADVKIANSNKGRVLSYDYVAQTDLFLNISVLVHFKADVPMRGGGGIE